MVCCACVPLCALHGKRALLLSAQNTKKIHYPDEQKASLVAGLLPFYRVWLLLYRGHPKAKMYISVYDPNRITLIGSYEGDIPDKEWQATYDDVLRVLHDARQQRAPSIVIVLSHPSTSRPNATWRKKLAEIRLLSDKTLRSYTVVVTSSMVLRSIMTAINWVSPKGELEENFVTGSFDEAILWLQKQTGQPLPHLAPLYEELLRKTSVAQRRSV
jgi:hypothetical protein